MAKIIKKHGEYILKEIHLSQVNEMYLDCDANNSIEVKVEIVDKRLITEKQRRFIFALCNEIAYYIGESAEWVRMFLQTYNANLRDIEVESLSKCDMTYANNLINTIINFCIDQEIPFAKKLIDEYGYTFDMKQTYSMCLKRVCVVCGQRADLHHVDRVGLGRNRKNISHEGMKMLPLCRNHHTECHTIGDATFIEKHHLQPIVVDEKLDYFLRKGKLRIYE